jgi:hypothetical protein
MLFSGNPLGAPLFGPPVMCSRFGFGGGKRSGLVSIVQLESAAGKRSDIVFLLGCRSLAECDATSGDHLIKRFGDVFDPLGGPAECNRESVLCGVVAV